MSALAEIGRWRERTERDIQSALVEIGREELLARQALEDAHRRLLALASVRREQEELLDRVTSEQEMRERRAIQEGLQADRDLLQQRARALAAELRARGQLVSALIAGDPDYSAALAELERFREVELSGEVLPASYQRALRDQRERARRRLEPAIAAVNAPLSPLEAHLSGIGVVVAVEPPEGPPEALVAVLPVPFAVYRDWASRTEDLTTQFAYRMVSAIFALLAEHGAAASPVQYLEVEECLAVQVWLGDARVEGDFRERALELIHAATDDAPEMTAAGVEVYAVVVRPELLIGEGA